MHIIMRPTIIRYSGQDIFKHLIKPSCIQCKFCNPIIPEKKPSKEQMFQSTCKKFLVSPNNYQNSVLGDFDFREKNPYALMARLDITMCGLHGKYFTKK